MTRGLRVPVGVDASGQARWVDRDESAIQTIALTLSDNSSDNAFLQGIGMPQVGPFSLAGSSRAEIMAQLFSIFDRFEELKQYRLQRETVRWVTVGEEEFLTFEFVNLESDQVVPFTRPVGRISAPSTGQG